MPYSSIYPTKPKWLKHSTKLLRILVYVTSCLTGIGAILLTPQTLESRFIFLSTDVWGTIVILGSLGCLVGATLGRFRWELSFIPVIISGVWVYFAAIVDSLLTTPTRAVQASVVLTLIFMLYIRLLELVSAYRKAKTLFDIESSM